ncbi:hypothetical protein ElyMa_001181100 [Elysia marginata]|uniref:Uncharacterized protein n=1 Tax=Elysia marginata TaxID=1093978 RepID=A0AAV4I2X5_9GAST|nr:hypothetical protein ElyMa_001181100 [Elysia marginata]
MYRKTDVLFGLGVVLAPVLIVFLGVLRSRASGNQQVTATQGKSGSPSELKTSSQIETSLQQTSQTSPKAVQWNERA